MLHIRLVSGAGEIKKDGNVLLYNYNHCVQATSWDCGITCIMIILSQDQAENLRQNLYSICPEECQNQRFDHF